MDEANGMLCWRRLTRAEWFAIRDLRSRQNSKLYTRTFYILCAASLLFSITSVTTVEKHSGDLLLLLLQLRSCGSCRRLTLPAPIILASPRFPHPFSVSLWSFFSFFSLLCSFCLV